MEADSTVFVRREGDQVGWSVSEVLAAFVTNPATLGGRLSAFDELGIEKELSRFIVTQVEVDNSLEKLCARIVKDRVSTNRIRSKQLYGFAHPSSTYIRQKAMTGLRNLPLCLRRSVL
jgi:hypothetical protein